MFWLNRQQIVEHSDGQECLLFLGVKGTTVLNKSYETLWLVVTGTWLWFCHVLGSIIPIGIHIFQRGRYTTNQLYIAFYRLDFQNFVCQSSVSETRSLATFWPVSLSPSAFVSHILREMGSPRIHGLIINFNHFPNHFPAFWGYTPFSDTNCKSGISDQCHAWLATSGTEIPSCLASIVGPFFFAWEGDSDLTQCDVFLQESWVTLWVIQHGNGKSKINRGFNRNITYGLITGG